MTQRPLRLGISASFFHADAQRAVFKGKTLLYVEESLAQWVQTRGALGYLLPSSRQPGVIKAFLQDVDGVVLQGGADVAPSSYKESPARPDWCGDAVRDAYELELLNEAVAHNKPVLGICRGAQLINVAFGGTLYQDIETFYQKTAGKKPQVHRDWHVYDQLFHDVTFAPHSQLRTLYKTPGGRVNSVHHQAVKKLGDNLVVEATALDDGMVEAIRHTGDAYVFGVQWHPEFTASAAMNLLDPQPILDDFLHAVQTRR